MRIDTLITDARIASMVPGETPYGVIEDGAIAISGDTIAWVGQRRDAPTAFDRVHSVDGRWITPALIDCHTHLVFAGDRSDEYERRLAGETYADIAKSGGGIARTVEATRQSNSAQLAAAALRCAARIPPPAELGGGNECLTGSCSSAKAWARRLVADGGIVCR